jgi:hypothetical protein
MLIGPRRLRYPAIRRTIALDNFPRAYGSDKRFGIVSVDWEIQKRIPNGPLWPESQRPGARLAGEPSIWARFAPAR